MFPIVENTNRIAIRQVNMMLTMNNLLGLLLKNGRAVRSENAIRVPDKSHSKNQAVLN